MKSNERDALLSAMQENYIAYFRQFITLPGVVMHEGADMTWFVAPTAPGQHVLRTRLGAADALWRITETLDDVGQLSTDCQWLVFEQDTPANLGDLLQTCGLVRGTGDPWMAASLSALPSSPAVPDNFHIERIYDSRGLEDWTLASAAGFGMPVRMAHIWQAAYLAQGFELDAHSIHFIGYLDDQPAVAATLLLSPGIAGIFDVATVPRFRRQGLASAITHAAMTWAREVGYRRACLQASAMGVSLYQRLGFRTQFRQVHYLWERQ